MATDEPLLKNLTRVWKVQELEGIDPNFTKAGSVSDKVIDFCANMSNVRGKLFPWLCASG